MERKDLSEQKIDVATEIIHELDLKIREKFAKKCTAMNYSQTFVNAVKSVRLMTITGIELPDDKFKSF